PLRPRSRTPRESGDGRRARPVRREGDEFSARRASDPVTTRRRTAACQNGPLSGKELAMATVVAGFSMSLDGFVADRSDNVGPLFDWYGNGEVEVRWPGNDMVSHTTPQSA